VGDPEKKYFGLTINELIALGQLIVMVVGVYLGYNAVNSINVNLDSINSKLVNATTINSSGYYFTNGSSNISIVSNGPCLTYSFTDGKQCLCSDGLHKC